MKSFHGGPEIQGRILRFMGDFMWNALPKFETLSKKFSPVLKNLLFWNKNQVDEPVQ